MANTECRLTECRQIFQGTYQPRIFLLNISHGPKENMYAAYIYNLCEVHILMRNTNTQS